MESRPSQQLESQFAQIAFLVRIGDYGTNKISNRVRLGKCRDRFREKVESADIRWDAVAFSNFGWFDSVGTYIGLRAEVRRSAFDSAERLCEYLERVCAQQQLT